jgi:hypothetical protein
MKKDSPKPPTADPESVFEVGRCLTWALAPNGSVGVYVSEKPPPEDKPGLRVVSANKQTGEVILGGGPEEVP